MIVVLALVFLALHLPYLPASLEDLDSINFALGIRAFDVAHHQPHPPGYPVFILLAKAVHALVPVEAAALGLLSAVAAALGVLAIAALFRRLDGPDVPSAWSIAGVAVAMTTPLYWFTAVRPLSDATGLAAAVAVQAMTLAASGPRAFAAAAFCAGLATGVRSQVLWLTLPLLIAQGSGAWRLGLGRGSGSATDPQHPAPSTQLLAAAAFALGAALWFLPLVFLSGGLAAYWHALFDQGAEDFGNIQMLWNNHSPRDLRDAAYYAFVAPWAAWPVAAVALSCALAGIVRLARQQRQTLIVLVIAFGPYLVFDLLFQETFTGRYALPLVLPIAYLAVTGLRALPWDTGLAVAVVLAMFCAHLGGTSVAAYSRVAAPAFRLLDTMRRVAQLDPITPVLAMDRRESLDLRRPITWIGDALSQSAVRNSQFAEILAAPPQHEWLEAVKYWNGGGRAPVWFVVDPARASIDLVQHGEPQRFRWPLLYPVLLSGVRPNEMDLYRVQRPEWYVGEGWSLTPEAAGVAEADHRNLSSGPIRGWMSGETHLLMIGGRNLEPTIRPKLTVTFGGRWPALRRVELAPGPFLFFVESPTFGWDDRPEYVAVDVVASPPARVAVEQFDASPDRALWGFGEGWYEAELSPDTGAHWRWLSGRGELQFIPRRAPLMLHLDGESPRKYFARGSHFVIRSRDRIIFDRVLTGDFSLDVPLDNSLDRMPGPGPDVLVFETDQTYVPAERSGRTADQRHLGLRILKVSITPAS